MQEMVRKTIENHDIVDPSKKKVRPYIGLKDEGIGQTFTCLLTYGIPIL